MGIKRILGLKSAKYETIPFINATLLKTSSQTVDLKDEIVPNLGNFRRILKTNYLESSVD